MNPGRAKAAVLIRHMGDTFWNRWSSGARDAPASTASSLHPLATFTPVHAHIGELQREGEAWRRVPDREQKAGEIAERLTRADGVVDPLPSANFGKPAHS
jgi:hypothetical protein